MGLLLLIVVVLLMLGAVPSWPHARDWGYGPSGVLALLLIVLLVMVVLGAIPWWGWGGHAVVVR